MIYAGIDTAIIQQVLDSIVQIFFGGGDSALETVMKQLFSFNLMGVPAPVMMIYSVTLFIALVLSLLVMGCRWVARSFSSGPTIYVPFRDMLVDVANGFFAPLGFGLLTIASYLVSRLIYIVLYTPQTFDVLKISVPGTPLTPLLVTLLSSFAGTFLALEVAIVFVALSYTNVIAYPMTRVLRRAGRLFAAIYRINCNLIIAAVISLPAVVLEIGLFAKLNAWLENKTLLPGVDSTEMIRGAISIGAWALAVILPLALPFLVKYVEVKVVGGTVTTKQPTGQKAPKPAATKVAPAFFAGLIGEAALDEVVVRRSEKRLHRTATAAKAGAAKAGAVGRLVPALAFGAMAAGAKSKLKASKPAPSAPQASSPPATLPPPKPLPPPTLGYKP